MNHQDIIQLLEIASCELHSCYKRLEIEKSNVSDLVQCTCDKIKNQKWVYANFYQDETGKFISDEYFDSYKKAFDNRDNLSTYVGTFLIIM